MCEHQPGESDLLSLGGGECAAARTDHGVEALGQRLDPFEGIDRGQGRADVVVLHPAGDARRSREGDVLPQGADEDVMLLGDQRDVAAQVGERQLH
ncbi:MAG TPA: hypothetical protein PL137_05275, partial [Nocardioides sp.]|nr:hypothetical protein [Nocardioides sp.]